MDKKISGIGKLFIGILLVVFGGVVLHAPISVGLSSVTPQYTPLIKSWKEVLLGVALILAVVLIVRQKRWDIIKTRILYIIAGLAALNVVLIPTYYMGFEATVAGLFINLRFLLFFALVYIAIKLYPQAYRLFLITFMGGALIVMTFAILQVTVLPSDVLKYIGYGQTTIMPYLTVDQNINYIRINSTLRGPNPLGAYVVIVLSAVLAAWLRRKQNMTTRQQVVAAILAAGAVVALWASYSRSALIGAFISVAIVAGAIYLRRITKLVWIALAAGLLVVAGGFVAFRDTQFVSQVVLHEDPSEGGDINSNDGHVQSLMDGVGRMVHEPLGAGIGSTGSASLRSDSPLIIENQYLFVAHENGWMGLALFLAISYYVLTSMWQRRNWWLALAVYASGIGLMVVGLFLPVWSDDTVAIVWWGLAALVLATPVLQLKHKTKK